MTDDPVRGFLGRWSRLKREAASADDVPAPVATDDAVRLPDVAHDALAADAVPPPLESLAFESDYRAFLGRKVDEGLKRMALKKLFHAPHFNTMDGLDVYTEDFNVFEPMPKTMVAELMHAKETLSPTLPEDWLKPVAVAGDEAPGHAPDVLAEAERKAELPQPVAETPDEPVAPAAPEASVDEHPESRFRSE